MSWGEEKIIKNKSSGLSHQIEQKLIEQIIQGELKQGDKIIEKTYADLFGVSRAPVREAIYKLARGGLIIRYPKKGAFVRKYSYYELIDLLEIRNMLEYMALEKLDLYEIEESKITKLRSIHEKMIETEDILQYTNLNYEFHLVIISMCESQPIMDVYSRLGWVLLRTQYLSFSQKNNLSKSLHDHHEILQLIKTKNKVPLIRVMLEHNSHVITSIRNIIAESE